VKAKGIRTKSFMLQEQILNDIERQIRSHCFFDNEEKYVAKTLWIATSYFLKHDTIRVFDAFPMLAFMSPEPDSGKSRALTVTQLLACNSISAGSYTPAMLLAKIDREPEKILTICLDEIDTVFSHGKDNADLIRLLNLGYQRGAVIGRLSRFKDGEKETKAYCPKVFAGLKVAKIPDATKTRTIIISMRPKGAAEKVERHVNVEALAGLRERLGKLSDDETFLTKLSEVQVDTSFLNNRNEQLWEPLLVVARAVSADWYQRGAKAARYFTSGKTKDLSHTILVGAYRVFRSGEFPDKIHSIDLLEQLQALGLPRWLDQSHLSEYLSAYDPDIATRQMKISGLNRNGYDWHTFLPTFEVYLSENEKEVIEREVHEEMRQEFS
jgi:hypothetical protein